MPKKKAVNKGGRPPIGDKAFDSTVLIECHSEQKARWKKAAAKSPHKSLSAWLRSLADKEAGRRD